MIPETLIILDSKLIKGVDFFGQAIFRKNKFISRSISIEIEGEVLIIYILQ